MKKILIIGAHGTIGQAVVTELGLRHNVMTASRTNGDFKVDLASEASIVDLYRQIGLVDAVACVAGSGYFAPMAKLNPENFTLGLKDKMLGQINLVLIGQHLLADKGSFTLISGVLSNEPILEGLNSSTINAAIEGFTRAAAIELPRGIRINVVNPTLVTESAAGYAPYFRGFDSVPAAKVALAYSKSIEGAQTGQIFNVR
jgi:NAD(P)-dependent dehydrogenase (short-subunit alcohol dehydrogenase family)